MSKSVCGRSIAIVLALLLPLVMIGIQNTVVLPSVWIVYADNQDSSIELAAETFARETVCTGAIVKETMMDRLYEIPLHADAIVLVGHGQMEGLLLSDSIVSWDIVCSTLESRRPRLTLLLACYSPSDVKSRVYGFSNQVDAESGAILASWLFKNKMDFQGPVPFDRALSAQQEMVHPLESYVYFIHGYFGQYNAFDMMESWLRQAGVEARYGDNSFREFSYWKPYWDLLQDDFDTWDDFMWMMHSTMEISDYADDFACKLIDEHGDELGVQIDIVAHSLGGLIAREMIRN